MAWCWHSSKLWQTSRGEFMLDLKINKLGQWEGSSIKFQRYLTWKSESLHSGEDWSKHCPISTLSNPNFQNPTFFRAVSMDPQPQKGVPKQAAFEGAPSRTTVSILTTAINKPCNLRQISLYPWALSFSVIKYYWISKDPCSTYRIFLFYDKGS